MEKVNGQIVCAQDNLNVVRHYSEFYYLDKIKRG